MADLDKISGILWWGFYAFLAIKGGHQEEMHLFGARLSSRQNDKPCQRSIFRPNYLSIAG
jgi:hypothetical protein